MIRLVLGILLAPLVSPLGAWLTRLPIILISGGNPRSYIVDGVPLIYLAYAIILIGGLPWLLYFRNRGWISAPAIVCLGALLGAAPFLIFGISNVVYTGVLYVSQLKNIPSMILPFLGMAASGAVIGGICTSAFWLIAVWRNAWFTEIIDS